jgi:hypothetical protein
MTRITWVSDSRGAEYRAPTFRVYLSRVVAAPEAEESKPGGWLGEVRAAYWKPLRLNWGANGRPSTLTLRRVLGVGAGKATRTRAEEECFVAGDRVRLVEVQRGGPRGTIQREWFRGHIGQERILVQADPDAETGDVVAYGPEILLQGKAVSGQWHAAPEADESVISGTFSPELLRRENTFRSHLPVVFNEAGRPNASPSQSGGNDARWRLDSSSEAESAEGRTFEAAGRRVATAGATYEATTWRARAAVQSLIEMVDDYEIISPESVSLLPSGLSDRAIGEVGVEGMNLLEALRAVLLPIGYGFALEPWADQVGRHRLHVFALHGAVEGSRVRKPYMAPICGAAARITDPAAQQAEVQRIEFVRDNHNVANDVTVVGDQKRKQVTLVFASSGSQLRPAWDTEAHDLANWATDNVVDPMQWPVQGQSERTVEYFDERFTYGAKGNTDYRHVFRSFAWNEDGAFNEVIGQMGDLHDYGVGAEQNYVRRPRPVGPTFLRDDATAQARNLPSFVQLGIEGDGDSWIQIPAVIWAGRAGFTIPINPLWQWFPYTSEYARHAPAGGETLFGKHGGHSYLTLLHNTLRGSGKKLVLRLVGSIECDEAVTGRAGRRVGGSWPLTAARAIRAENRFRHRDVPGGSDPFSLEASRHDTRDDSEDAADFACGIRDVLEDEVGHGSITLRHLTRAYAPGDVIPGTRGRVIDLTVRAGEAAHGPVVVEVVWNFQDGVNKTELVLDTPLLKVTQ